MSSNKLRGPDNADWPALKRELDAMHRKLEQTEFPANIASFLRAKAAEHGDKPLWTFFEEDERATTYAEALAAVEACAAGLHSVGIGKGSHVAVMLPNIAQFPVTWLALLWLGAVQVPVNIAYTGRELHYVLTDSDATHLVIGADFLPAYADLGADAPFGSDQVLVVGDGKGVGRSLAEVVAKAPALPADLPQPGLDDLANIQYTSGTTGFPKGCMLPHRYWLTLATVASMRFGTGDGITNILVAQPFFYMDPQWLTLMAMRVGGQTFVARRASSSRFMDWVHRYKPHYCIFPEIVAQQPARPDDADCSLRLVSIFGHNREKHAAVEKRFGFTARESFGMTEVGSALYTPTEATFMVGSGTCGIPSPFREARIIDADGNTLPDGVVGELCIRGPGIMQGYYKKPEANAASFQDGWFRTGDLFWRDQNGFHYIVGRLKEMIRRSGENIAAREVEAVLTELPEVLEAAAVGVKDPQRGEEVKAYLVLKPGVTPRDLPPEAVFEHCATRLAAFKTPRFLEYIDELPKTPSGKVTKPKLVAMKPDLRAGSYDRQTGTWLPQG
jgi:crotonobetaine/carnitine-CoA ligase